MRLASRAWLLPALEPLWGGWVRAGYTLSVQEWLQIERLLQTLPEPLETGLLCDLLCPLVARDPEAQVQFRRLFADCFPDASIRQESQGRVRLLGSPHPVEPAPTPIPTRTVKPQQTFLEWLQERPEGSSDSDDSSTEPYHWPLVLPGGRRPLGPDAQTVFSPFDSHLLGQVPFRVRRAGIGSERLVGGGFAPAASVKATLAAAGCPTLVPGTCHRRRSVVAVVEYPCLHDHRVPYYLSLLWQLVRLGAEMQVWVYSVSEELCYPLVCRAQGFMLLPTARALPLERAFREARRAEGVFLWCGEGAPLCARPWEATERRGGALTAEARALAEGWQSAILFPLSPHPKPAFDGTLTIVPASWEALEQVLSRSPRSPSPRGRAAGRQAETWLSGCAVLPELRWDLTLALGKTLGVVNEESLRALLALPWFQGSGESVYHPLPPEVRVALAALAPPAALDWAESVLGDGNEALLAPEGSYGRRMQQMEAAMLAQRRGDDAVLAKRLAKLPPSFLSQHPTLREAYRERLTRRLKERLTRRLKPYPALLAYLESLCRIPGGTFTMGTMGKTLYDDQKPAHEVTLSPFWLGRTPVTVEMWQEFCTVTKRELPELPDSPGWTAGWKSMRSHPIVNVSWEECVAFCQWVSALVEQEVRLPSEAQWEFGARGGKEQEEYPWGTNYDSAKLWSSQKHYGDSGGTASVSRNERIFVNGYGLVDMSGNVYEWCSDWWEDDYKEREKRDRKDPEGPKQGNLKVVRGGSWYSFLPYYLNCAYRFRYTRDYRHDIIGFRLSSPGAYRKIL